MPKRKRFSKTQPRQAKRSGRPAAEPPRDPSRDGRAGRDRRPHRDDGAYWLYGTHAVAAAIANPRRRLLRVLHTCDTAETVESLFAAARPREADPIAVERVDRGALDRLLPDGAVHQGLAARVAPLPPVDLDEICDAAGGDATVLLLDRVTDPHNVGAILRSAAAFGAAAVILTERNAAPESGTLAKAASGALEQVPLVRVVNLARAMDRLKRGGFWCIGLAAEAGETLAAADLSGRIALALGSEGGGLRRLTRDRCDLLVRLPTTGPIADLNVSNAAAVALYERVRNRPSGPGVGPSRRPSGPTD